MSSSNTNTTDVDAIRFINNMFSQIWSYLLICLGTIGHLLYIYVFPRPVLRSNPCVRYFLAATLTGFIVVYVNVTLRLVQQSYNLDAFGYSIASCKILTFIAYWARTQTSWFIALASIDRSQSAVIRAWSNLLVAAYTILLMILVVCLAYIYVPISFEIKQGRWKCPSNQGDYRTFYAIWSLFIFSLGPSVIMLIFGSLTIRRVQQSMKRVLHQNTDESSQINSVVLRGEQFRRQKLTDRQLIRMMIVQCIYFSIMSTPISIYWIYKSSKIYEELTTLESAKNDLFGTIAGNISITCACTTFYLFTLSSPLFRHKLRLVFNNRFRLNQQTRTNEIHLRERS